MIIKRIQQNLNQWYEVTKRPLPWRTTRNPYHIWISEIILQQTQVVQGENYYLRFLETFPDTTSLAEAPQEQVLKLWQGLGYYSRARNIHAAAQQIQSHFGGTFPDNYPDILSLKGVGPYTAAAIASFAFNLPYATVDGNVYRVLSRLFGIDTPIDSTEGVKQFRALAQELLNLEDPATHNQAMMEMGALQCRPINPDCTICPLQNECVAYKNNLVNLLPIKLGKTKVRNRYFYYLNIMDRDNMLIQQRNKKDVWQGLYEFPLIERVEETPLEELLKLEEFTSLIDNEFTIEHITNVKKHILSHQHIYGQCITIRVKQCNKRKSYHAIAQSEFYKYPISRLIEKLLEHTTLHIEP